MCSWILGRGNTKYWRFIEPIIGGIKTGHWHNGYSVC